jgi:hypothetical protein
MKASILSILVILLLVLCPFLTACQDSTSKIPPSSTPKDSHGNYILDDAQQYGTQIGLAPGDTDYIKAHKADFGTWFPQGYTYQTYQESAEEVSYTSYVIKFNTYTTGSQIAWQDEVYFDTFNAPDIDTIYEAILEQVIAQEIINEDLNGTEAAAFNQVTLSPSDNDSVDYYWNPNDLENGYSSVNSYNCNIILCDQTRRPLEDLTDFSQINQNVKRWYQVAENQSLQQPLASNSLWKAAVKNHICLGISTFVHAENPPYQQFRRLAQQKAKDFGVDVYYDDNNTMTKVN